MAQSRLTRERVSKKDHLDRVGLWSVMWDNLDQAGLWSDMWGIVLITIPLVDVGRVSPPWVAPFPRLAPWTVKW